MRQARAWQAKTGASVRICDTGSSVHIEIDNPPRGFASVCSPEDFFRKIGGKFTEAPKPQPRPQPPQAKSPGRWDMYSNYFRWGANCGPVAIAAILGKPIDDIRRLIPDFGGRNGMTTAQIMDALRRAGVNCREIGAQYPSYGIAFVKADGAAKGHFIAVAGQKVLDTFTLDALHLKDWCDLGRWESANRRYKVRSGIEVER